MLRLAVLGLAAYRGLRRAKRCGAVPLWTLDRPECAWLKLLQQEAGKNRDGHGPGGCVWHL